MTRAGWILLALLTAPATVLAAIVSATFGPLGAAAYCGLLLASINARHLFPDHHDDTRTNPIRINPIRIIRERLHR